MLRFSVVKLWPTEFLAFILSRTQVAKFLGQGQVSLTQPDPTQDTQHMRIFHIFSGPGGPPLTEIGSGYGAMLDYCSLYKLIRPIKWCNKVHFEWN